MACGLKDDGERISESHSNAENDFEQADLSKTAVAELQDAREELWKSWESALSTYYQRRQSVLQVENNKNRSTTAKPRSQGAAQAESREDEAGRSHDVIPAGTLHGEHLIGWLALHLTLSRVCLMFRYAETNPRPTTESHSTKRTKLFYGVPGSASFTCREVHCQIDRHIGERDHANGDVVEKEKI